MGYIWTERSAPGSTAHGIILARTWSGLTFPTPGDVPGPGIEFASPVALALAGEFSTTEPSGKFVSFQGQSTYYLHLGKQIIFSYLAPGPPQLPSQSVALKQISISSYLGLKHE